MEGSISAIMQELLCMFEVNELRWLGLNLQVYIKESDEAAEDWIVPKTSSETISIGWFKKKGKIFILRRIKYYLFG